MHERYDHKQSDRVAGVVGDGGAVPDLRPLYDVVQVTADTVLDSDEQQGAYDVPPMSTELVAASDTALEQAAVHPELQGLLADALRVVPPAVLDNVLVANVPFNGKPRKVIWEGKAYLQQNPGHIDLLQSSPITFALPSVRSWHPSMPEGCWLVRSAKSDIPVQKQTTRPLCCWREPYKLRLTPVSLSRRTMQHVYTA